MASFLDIEMHFPIDSVDRCVGDRYTHNDTTGLHATTGLLIFMAETVEETVGLTRWADFDLFYSSINFTPNVKREQVYDMSGDRAITLVIRNNQSVNYNSKEFLASIMALKLKFDGALLLS